ncbi:MAG: hypothetical protein CMM25_05195 [Rhodospirillaceae bacterium]|nr:hypothetical protein [Rhodospirillaceae bacterium]|tara:strand:- start:366 stop:677 length:312 start_codon:yes stop_codon:yes gene_type:complete
MVKVTNTTDRVLIRRHPSGTVLKWAPQQTKEVTSKRLLEEISRQECFVVGKEVGTKDIGGGLKTGVRKPKANSKPARAKPKKEVKKEAKPKKGLKKSKKEKAD